MQWAVTKLPSGTLERRWASQRRLMCWGDTTPTVTFSPRPLKNLRAGGNRPPSTRCGPIPNTSSGLRMPRIRLRRWSRRGKRSPLFRRCGLTPPRSTSSNPSNTRRRSKRWVPLLGIELATTLIALAPHLPIGEGRTTASRGVRRKMARSSPGQTLSQARRGEAHVGPHAGLPLGDQDQRRVLHHGDGGRHAGNPDRSVVTHDQQGTDHEEGAGQEVDPQHRSLVAGELEYRPAGTRPDGREFPGAEQYQDYGGATIIVAVD